jgi:hypothetical protein
MPYDVGVVHSGSDTPKQQDHIVALKEGVTWAGYGPGGGPNNVHYHHYWADDQTPDMNKGAGQAINGSAGTACYRRSAVQ